MTRTEQYELLYCIPAKYTDEEISAIREKMSGILKNAGATVTATHDLGKRKLAYPISHARVGHYVLTHFDADTPVISVLNETLRLTTDVLRHLIVKRDPRLTKIPSFAEVEEPRVRREDRFRAAPREGAPRGRPTQLPGSAAPMSAVELDKKLDEILTEEIL